MPSEMSSDGNGARIRSCGAILAWVGSDRSSRGMSVAPCLCGENKGGGITSHQVVRNAGSIDGVVRNEESGQVRWKQDPEQEACLCL